MRLSEIENWAHSVIAQVEAGQQNEDSRVELKSTWLLDLPRAARRLAGHANAARGESILWLIGVDEKTGVIGAKREDFAAWYAGVKTEFDGLAPEVISINVPTRGNTVVALFFETDRAPFVVRNPAFGSPAGGPVERE